MACDPLDLPEGLKRPQATDDPMPAIRKALGRTKAGDVKPRKWDTRMMVSPVRRSKASATKWAQGDAPAAPSGAAPVATKAKKPKAKRKAIARKKRA